MRLALSFILPLLAVLALIAYATIPLFDRLTLAWTTRDLDARARLVTNTLHDALAPNLTGARVASVAPTLDRMAADERLVGVALCDERGRLLYRTRTLPAEVDCASPVELRQGALHVTREELHDDAGAVEGQLIFAHDMTFFNRRSRDTRHYLFALFATLGLVISSVTVIIARLNLLRLLGRVTSLVRGGALVRRLSQQSPELVPLARDLRVLIRDIESDRRTRDEDHVSWDPQALKRILNEELAGDEIMIVSNREPYIHNRRDGKIETQFPASGLITALEPIMRACSGTWIAHGSGTADRDVVDAHDHVAVPPDNPTYQIRRVWFTPEEERGYYYGFSNEGLWPLCHTAYTQPIFRSSDFAQYKAVNQKFADAVVQEAKTEDPVILVQDYHLGLLPRMIRDRLPKATIITFWHIPWPNAEAFGICPWRDEILDGMLGSSILGFHTRFHCNNFLDTVDRYLESRVDREMSTVWYGAKATAVRSYPISIEWPAIEEKSQKTAYECHKDIRRSNALPDHLLLGIGVDRLDYTKGILERFAAVERLLERRPEWIERFTFIQIAAPTRTGIEQYQSFEGDVRAAADRINRRFGRGGYVPILLKVQHHKPARITEYFRGCDVCMVTSLHDGMNLVAKEFVAAREDERGVLILSQFTGASRELPEALIVNPYDIDQCATALHLSLTMPPEEQRDRLRSMRGLVAEFNVYRWAGRMLMDGARIRSQSRLRDRLHEAERI